MAYKPSFSDEAVAARTGHGWTHWFKLLDRWGARKQTHKEIARHLGDRHGVPGWWCQMITGEYEKARGLRAATGQQCDTDRFQASVQRTVPVTSARAYKAIATSAGLRTWMGDEAGIQARKGGAAILPGLGEGRVRIADRNKRLRMGFDGRGAAGSTVEITLTSTGAGKCAVRVQHTDLKTEAAFKRYKAGWTRRLEALKSALG